MHLARRVAALLISTAPWRCRQRPIRKTWDAARTYRLHTESSVQVLQGIEIGDDRPERGALAWDYCSSMGEIK